MDMHSWGFLKEKRAYILIEAPQEEAEVIFYNKFRHSPNRITCTCCGEDYSIDENETLEQATGYNRGCKYDDKKKKYIESPRDSWRRLSDTYIPLDVYIRSPDVLIIPKEKIKDKRRVWEIPQQGYVWVE